MDKFLAAKILSGEVLTIEECDKIVGDECFPIKDIIEITTKKNEHLYLCVFSINKDFFSITYLETSSEIFYSVQVAQRVYPKLITITAWETPNGLYYN